MKLKIVSIITVLSLVLTVSIANAAVIGSLALTPTIAVLGGNITVSGNCGTSVAGNAVTVALVRYGAATNIGTTTTDASGNFSGSFAVPSNFGGGPITIEATCPNGTVTANSALFDPFAIVTPGNATLRVSNAFTVTGVCGTTAGGEVTLALVSGSTSVNVGTTLTSSSGSFSTVLTVPNNFPLGSATLFAMCPTGNIMTASLFVEPPGTVTPPVTIPLTSDVSTTP
ncbi:MAG TPA: hypothetical protein VGQ87_04095, partial [Patescibacteria group bacterium]|nr:hypothetical protein [Patescibacteria group bacterium]